METLILMLEKKKPGEENPIKSGYTAFVGFVWSLKSESSVRGFLFSGLIVTGASIFLQVGFFESCLLFLVWMLVPAMEIMNTSIETTLDYASDKEKANLVKKGKDLAAGVVFLMSATAWILSAAIFIRHFFF